MSKEENQKLTNSLELQISRNQQLENEINILEKDLIDELNKNQYLKEEIDPNEKKYRWDYELQLFSGRDNKLAILLRRRILYMKLLI